MIKCWSRLLLLCMQFDHWTCYKTLLVFHLSTSSRDDQSYRFSWVSEWYFLFCVQCLVNTKTKQNGGQAKENIIVNNLNFIPVLIFSQEVHRWPAYIYLYLFIYLWFKIEILVVKWLQIYTIIDLYSTAHTSHIYLWCWCMQCRPNIFFASKQINALSKHERARILVNLQLIGRLKNGSKKIEFFVRWI